MRTSSNIIFLICIGLLLSSSCSKQESFQSSLVIISLINPDEAFEVRVQRTAETLGDHSDLNIETAFVTMTNNSTQETVKMFPQGDGVYRAAGTKPLPGYDYEIQVKVEGFPDAAATTYVPDLGSVVVSDASLEIDNDEVTFSFAPTMISGKDENYYAYELVYIDPADEEEEEEEDGGSIPVDPSETVGPDKPSNADPGTTSLKPVYGSVEDGDSVPVETIRDINIDIKHISVRIVAVSSEFYDYLIMESESADKHHSSIYSNNSHIYSNFIGDAYGVFGGFNEKTIKLVQ